MSNHIGNMTYYLKSTSKKYGLLRSHLNRLTEKNGNRVM